VRFHCDWLLAEDGLGRRVKALGASSPASKRVQAPRAHSHRGSATCDGDHAPPHRLHCVTRSTDSRGRPKVTATSNFSLRPRRTFEPIARAKRTNARRSSSAPKAAPQRPEVGTRRRTPAVGAPALPTFVVGVQAARELEQPERRPARPCSTG
jgi:hypothetical protein